MLWYLYLSNNQFKQQATSIRLSTIPSSTTKSPTKPSKHNLTPSILDSSASPKTTTSSQPHIHTHNNASNTQILPPRLHRLRRYVPLLRTPPSPLSTSPLTNTIPTVFAFSYTFIVASKEGAAMDMARTRWQHQHASARNVLSGGVTGLEGQ